MFRVGDLVVNLTSQIARVVAIHSNGDPILRAVSPNYREASGDLRAWGGKWLADPSKTRKLTSDEIAQFMRGGTEIIR